MTLMEFLSPQKIPHFSVRGQGSTIAGPQIKKPLKWRPQKRHPQFLFLDLAFLRGKNIRIYIRQKKLFSPIHSGVVAGSWNIQNLSAQLLFRRLSAIRFFSGGKHILATLAVGSHILKALCLDVLPTHGKLETIKQSWICRICCVVCQNFLTTTSTTNKFLFKRIGASPVFHHPKHHDTPFFAYLSWPPGMMGFSG